MNNQPYLFTLTDQEKELFGQELDSIAYDPNGHCQYLNELRVIAMKVLPKHLLTALIKQKASLSPLPFILIENLPQDEKVYKVPFHSEDPRHFKSGNLSENLILALASLVGEPYSIQFEGNEIVNNLIPSVSTANDFTGLGSSVELDFHIENAALKYLKGSDFSPLGLFLTGVHYDPNGPATLVADGRQALQLLSAKERQVLSEPRFQIKVPYRWRLALGEDSCTTQAVPIIREQGDYPDLAVAFYSDIVKALDCEAGKALENFYGKIKEVSLRFQIKPGSLLYIDNRFCLHAREAFQSTFDIEGRALRWIQRVFIAPHLWNHRRLIRPKHRVFNPVQAV